jgi:hypothetical protein
LEGGIAKLALVRMDGLDFMFENSLVRVVASRSCAEIRLAGLSVGPFEEGNEYEVCYWVALELARSGVVRFHGEDQLDTSKLGKIQWTERVQTAGQVSRLPEGFYPKLRRCLAELREGVANNPEKMREYERADHLATDILNSRMKKIVSMASAPAQTESRLRDFTGEEKLLYDQLFNLVNRWKTSILKNRGAR